MTESLRGCAERGMKYMDSVNPGWENKIPPNLDVGDDEHCPVFFITGQRFASGVAILGIDPVSMGFESGSHDPVVRRVEHMILTFHFRVGRHVRLIRKDAQEVLDAEAREEVEELELVGV